MSRGQSSPSWRRGSVVRSVLVALGVLAVAAGLIAAVRLFIGPPMSRFLFDLADADHGRLVWVVVGIGASVLPLGLLARAAHRRWGSWTLPLWALPVAPVVLLLGFLPARRGDDGRTAARLDRATELGAPVAPEVYEPEPSDRPRDRR